MIKKQIVIIILTIITLSATGCGFHLRGYNMVPPQLKLVYLQSANPYDPVTVMMRDNLSMLDVTLVSAPQQAPVTLQLLQSSFDKVLKNISSNTFVRTYLLVASVTFQLTDRKNQVVFGPETVTSTMSYTTSDNQLLGDAQVLMMRKQQLQRELIFKIFTRINSAQGRAALMKVS